MGMFLYDSGRVHGLQQVRSRTVAEALSEPAKLIPVPMFVMFVRVIRYATRFTDEVFALLIAAIFVIEALGSPGKPVGVFHYFRDSHDWHEKHADDPDYSYMEVALLSLIVTLGTMSLAYFFRGIKFTNYLWHPSLRNICSDFAVSISILVWTLVAQFGFSEIPLEELNVPDTIAPTFVCCSASCHQFWPDECPEIEVPYGRRPCKYSSSFPYRGSNSLSLIEVVLCIRDG